MRIGFALLAPLAASASRASAQVTTLQTVGLGGAQSNGRAEHPDVSRDGRYVAFECAATNLVPNDTNAVIDVFLRDRWTGVIERVSVASDGTQADFRSFEPSLSDNGRLVAFSSVATNLIPLDLGLFTDVFVRDRAAGFTELASVSSDGAQANDHSTGSVISGEGRYVAFLSLATNLDPTHEPLWDVFVRDRVAGTTERASLPPAEGWPTASGYPEFATLSSDGRFVGFCRMNDAFVRDRLSGTTRRVTQAFNGAPTDSYCAATCFSADGSRLAFLSLASNLVPGDTNNHPDVFVVDLPAGTIRCASVATHGGPANGASDRPELSEDGRFVAFASGATNLVPGDSNARIDVFLRDLELDATELVTVAHDGTQTNDHSESPALTGDGRFVAFTSYASDHVPGDSNSQADAFLRDRAASGFTSRCDPGSGGTIACPCGNPPSGAGRGCDNSQATGGASLAAAGTSYLSDDDLVFTTSGERATALSILLQGDSGAPGGIVYGQGVRCAAGSLKRLFTATASGGSIAVPGAGDPSVSARSAAAGDPILPGETRWYLVYYRDPIVLGGCPATSTFNVTQTGEVVWSP